MCRVLSYLGTPILVEELLYNPDNSLIKQSHHPRHMSYLLNLAGFGMIAWDNSSYNPEIPHIYKTSQLPFYDENLRNLSSKIKSSCLLSHIRGVPYSEKQVVSLQNVHPFIFEGTTFALAHNGVLRDFEKIKFDLINQIHPNFRKNIRGTTDSEVIYGVFLSQLTSTENYQANDIIEAINKTIRVLQQTRDKHHISTTSPINLFITNGEFLVATRYALDFGWQPFSTQTDTHFTYHSLWYTYGESYGCYDNEYKMKGGAKKNCIILASEPLTQDTTTWIEVPEYTTVVAWRDQNEIKIISQDIDL